MCFTSRLSAVLLGVVCSVFGGCAEAGDRTYTPYADVERGTDGLAPVTLTIENGAAGEIMCIASLAHWYSEELGTLAPGTALEASLWHDPESGELSLLNTLRDRMPVEAIWCHREKLSGEARTLLALPFNRGPVPPALRRICADARDGRLVCRDPKDG